MSKLLIYIGENQKFDKTKTIETIKSISGGVKKAREGVFIGGAVFECVYTFHEFETVVRLSDDVETITVEGLGEESLEFALRLQSKMPMPLSVIDMDYSFNLKLIDFDSVAELRAVIDQ